MTSLRRRATALSTAVPTALLLALALTACGGSDSEGSGGSGGSTGGDDGTSVDDITQVEGDSCDAEVEVSGAVEQTISTEGTVSTSESDVAPPATYQVKDGGLLLTVFAEGNGFDPSLLITTDATSYGMETGSAGLDAAADGSGFTADVEAGDIAGGDPVRVVATFTC